MKKLLVLLLAFAMCLTVFFGCSSKSDNKGSDGEKSKSIAPSTGTSSEGTTSDEVPVDPPSGDLPDDGTEYPSDILKGLPYTLVCKDETTGEVIDFEFTDNGRLNDGLYRSESELSEGKNPEMAYLFNGSSSYMYEMTFETDGSFDAYRFVVHNSYIDSVTMFSFDKIEVGDSIDNLKEIAIETDFDTIGRTGFLEETADFEVINVSVIRITFSTGNTPACTFDEVSLLGFPAGEADKWLPDGDEPPEAPSQGESDNKLIGTWSAFDPELLEEDNVESLTSFTFNADGTGIYVQDPAELPFTWYSSYGVIYMDMALAGEVSKPYKFTDEGYLRMADEDGRITYFRKTA